MKENRLSSEVRKRGANQLGEEREKVEGGLSGRDGEKHRGIGEAKEGVNLLDGSNEIEEQKLGLGVLIENISG